LAGVNVVEDTQNLSEADWGRVLATNLTGAFLFAKAAFPALAAAGQSAFVGISSINTMHPYPRRAAYAASKAGLEGLIRELAVEWGGHGIARIAFAWATLKRSCARPSPIRHSLTR